MAKSGSLPTRSWPSRGRAAWKLSRNPNRIFGRGARSICWLNPGQLFCSNWESALSLAPEGSPTLWGAATEQGSLTLPPHQVLKGVPVPFKSMPSATSFFPQITRCPYLTTRDSGIKQASKKQYCSVFSPPWKTFWLGTLKQECTKWNPNGPRQLKNVSKNPITTTNNEAPWQRQPYLYQVSVRMCFLEPHPPLINYKNGTVKALLKWWRNQTVQYKEYTIHHCPNTLFWLLQSEQSLLLAINASQQWNKELMK